MKFDYDECFDETELVLSSSEKKLIKTKAKELRKLCYQFKCCDFYTVIDCMDSDEEECNFTSEQVADKLGAILPFVKENKEELFEQGLFSELLREIETNMGDVVVSVLDSPLSKDDIQEELDEVFDSYEVANAFFKFCDRETACKVYDYLKKHQHDDEDED